MKKSFVPNAKPDAVCPVSGIRMGDRRVLMLVDQSELYRWCHAGGDCISVQPCTENPGWLVAVDDDRSGLVVAQCVDIGPAEGWILWEEIDDGGWQGVSPVQQSLKVVACMEACRRGAFNA